jgi:metallo-beta-lactamase family protein
MASKVLKVCLEHPELYDNDLKERIIEKANPLIYKNLVVLESVEQSKALNNRHTPCIIIAGSGMMTGGRILKHLQFNIENPLNTILIVGYQAEGTLGRQIVEGAREVEIDGRQFKVLAEIQAINEFSAHADQSILKRWISGMVSGNHGTKTRIFLMHGEKEASLGLSREIESGLFNQAESYWPRFGEKVQLWD